MYTDKKRVYLFSALVCSMLFLSFFIPVSLRRYVVAVFLVITAILVIYMIKKRSILSINKKQVLFIMFTIGLLYVMIYYLLGIEFGFHRNIYGLPVRNFFRFTVPIAIIIVAMELIRRVILAQKLLIPNILVYVSGVLVDLIIFINYDQINTFNVFMDILGMAFLPAFTLNLLYTYLSKNYGAWPNIAFRLITTLFIYFIPVLPSIPDIMESVIKFVLPFVIMGFISVLYAKQKRVVSHRKRTISTIGTVFAAVILIMFVMLISCKFKYGALVIGSESMTGSINKGDVVVYEEYTGQPIYEGDVIVFEVDGKKVIHRVVDIERINNIYRYYTKGDANEDMDSGYITEGQIVGVTHFRVVYIGYPSLWVRSIFD